VCERKRGWRGKHKSVTSLPSISAQSGGERASCGLTGASTAGRSHRTAWLRCRPLGAAMPLETSSLSSPEDNVVSPSPTSPLDDEVTAATQPEAAPNAAPTLVRIGSARSAAAATATSSTPTPKRPRVHFLEASALRVAMRVATYFAYDSVVVSRDAARVVKVLVELAIDEAVPPPPRGEMSLLHCCVENLAPCGVSSLAWFLARRVQGRKGGVARAADLTTTTARGVWIVVHRILRQALICRLFFVRGTVNYNLATALGLVCTFFREDLFRELHRLSRWPAHFDPVQGVCSCLRTIAYTVSFLLPLQNWCGALAARQRRSGAKKLIFAISLANARRVGAVLPHVAVGSLLR
jgi:hypothetical protein